MDIKDFANLTEQQLEDLLASKREKREREREAYRQLVDDTVKQACQRLQSAADILAEIKAEIFQSFKTVLALKEDVYSVKEQQRSHTFSTDAYGITIGYRVIDGWDDSASAGVAKVRNFIGSLAKDENSAALVDTVFNLLKKDAQGNLRANRVIELQKLTGKFNNLEFTDGVNIIMNAYKPVRSCWFVEAWLVGDGGKKINIPLSISSVDFPQGFEFEMPEGKKEAA